MLKNRSLYFSGAAISELERKKVHNFNPSFKINKKHVELKIGVSEICLIGAKFGGRPKRGGRAMQMEKIDFKNEAGPKGGLLSIGLHLPPSPEYWASFAAFP